MKTIAKPVRNEILGSATVKIRFSKYLFFSTTYQVTLFRYSDNGFNSNVFAIVREKKGMRVLGLIADENPIAGGNYSIGSTMPNAVYLARVLAAFKHLTGGQGSFGSREPLA